MLLRIARGTGIPGLAGMAPVGPIPANPRRSVVVVRPLLGERRDVIRLAAVGHPTVEDPTNDDADQRRARARYEALPALARLHPSEGDVVPLLSRLADFARTTSQAASSSTTSQASHPVAATRFGAAVDISTHGDQPLHRCEDALRRAWMLLDRAPPWPGGRLIGLLADLPVGASTDLPGAVRMTRVRLRQRGVTDRVVLRPIHRGPRPLVPLRRGVETRLPGFGTLRWTEAADGAARIGHRPGQLVGLGLDGDPAAGRRQPGRPTAWTGWGSGRPAGTATNCPPAARGGPAAGRPHRSDRDGRTPNPLGPIPSLTAGHHCRRADCNHRGWARFRHRGYAPGQWLNLLLRPIPTSTGS